MQKDLEMQTIEVVRKVSPAVVSIVISKLMPAIRKPASMQMFTPPGEFGIPLPEQELHDPLLSDPHAPSHKVKVGGGSGFIVNSNGLVITNKHVVFEPDADYTIVTSDDKEYKGKVISRDPINDVAILKIDADHLPVVEIGNSDSITLGQTAIAIGNALGLFSNSVSKGIISGLGRTISASLGANGEVENLRHVIQTDVAINQGNSGGPLVNLEGQVIGINTAVIFGAQNIGFALPINWAKSDLDDLKKFGRIIRPYIGVRYVSLSKDLKTQYDLPLDHGALVLRDHVPGSQAVIPNSPAAKAGIAENDIIVEADRTMLDDKTELADIISKHKVGDKIPLKVRRKDHDFDTDLILEERK